MKKLFLSILLVLSVAVMFAEGKYNIGDIGPGGGIIYYIAEADNMGYECSELLGVATLKNAESKCRSYKGGGYNDWSLPSLLDLHRIYENLCATGKMIGGWHWAMATATANYALKLSDGDQRDFSAYDYLAVRAVRSFTID